MPGNKVFITDEGIIEIITDGDQTERTVQQAADEAAALTSKLRAANRRVLIIDNLLTMGDVTPEARRLVVESVRLSQYDKLAMVGKGSLIRLAANLLLQATGRGHSVKYFDDYRAAVNWLLAE